MLLNIQRLSGFPRGLLTALESGRSDFTDSAVHHFKLRREVDEHHFAWAQILEMVANNQIDVPLLALFQTNINLAKSAGQQEAAEFMLKVMNACKKYACL